MGKTRNCRLTDDNKRIHKIAVEIRTKTDEQICEILLTERQNGKDEISKEYINIFKEVLSPIFNDVDHEFDGNPEDFRCCIHAMSETIKMFPETIDFLNHQIEE
jgi:hypothetical protein